MSCVSHAFPSVHCCLIVICRERAVLLALVGDVYCIFVTFPCGILGQVWYLIVSSPDLCCLSYLKRRYNIKGTYLDYTRLLKNIPKTWKEIINVEPDKCAKLKYNVLN